MVKGEIKFSFDHGGLSGIARVYSDEMMPIAKYSWKLENDEVVVTELEGNGDPYQEAVEEALTTYYDVLYGYVPWP